MDKAQVIYEWLKEMPYDGETFLLEWLESKHGACAVIPVASDPFISENVDGSKVMQYDFTLSAHFQLSDTTDNVNIDNIAIMDSFVAWLEQQEETGNYPDFGEKCSNYEIVPAANMSHVAYVNENMLAVYQFPARITYLEER